MPGELLRRKKAAIPNVSVARHRCCSLVPLRATCGHRLDKGKAALTLPPGPSKGPNGPKKAIYGHNARLMSGCARYPSRNACFLGHKECLPGEKDAFVVKEGCFTRLKARFHASKDIVLWLKALLLWPLAAVWSHCTVAKSSGGAPVLRCLTALEQILSSCLSSATSPNR